MERCLQNLLNARVGEILLHTTAASLSWLGLLLIINTFLLRKCRHWGLFKKITLENNRLAKSVSFLVFPLSLDCIIDIDDDVP